MNEVIKFALEGSFAAAIALLLLYIFKDSVSTLLNRSLQRDIENKKAEFARETERLKHELSKEAFKAEILTKSKSILYPELFKLMRIAEGAVGKLTGAQFVPDWNDMTDIEIKNYLINIGARERNIDDAILQIDRKTRTFSSIHDLYFSLQLFNAGKSIAEAKNYIIINELYFSSTITENTHNLLNLFFSIKIDSEMGKMDSTLLKRAQNTAKKLEESMNNFTKIMRKELEVE